MCAILRWTGIRHRQGLPPWRGCRKSLALLTEAHILHSIVSGNERQSAGFERHTDALPLRRCIQSLPPPRPQQSTRLERLAPIDRNKANDFVPHPFYGGVAAAHQQFDMSGCGSVDARDIVEALILAVGAWCMAPAVEFTARSPSGAA